MAIRFRKIMVIILLQLLAACGGVGQVVTEPPPLTFTPPPTPFVQGDCTLTTELESWLQTVTLRQREFARLVEDADSKSREALYADVERMGQILNSVSALPAPICAEQSQRAVIDAMILTADGFQAYVNQEREDLTTLVAEARRNFEGAVIALDNLAAQLEQQYAGAGE